MDRKRLVVGIITLVVGIGVASGVGGSAIGAETQAVSQEPVSFQQSTAENGINVSTTYPVSNDSQAVDVTVTVSPSEAAITNATIGITNSENAFIDYDSFSLSLAPSGAAEVEESLRTNGANRQKIYDIDSLETDETVTITFEAYPRQLQSDDGTLNVARVNYAFLRNGVEVPNSGPGQINAVADMSDSPAYAAQSAQSRISQMWITVGVGVAVGVIGLIAAVVLYLTNRDSGSSISRSRLRSVENDVRDLQRRLSAHGDDQKATAAEEIGDDLKDLRR